MTAQILFSETCIALGEHLSSIVLMTNNQPTNKQQQQQQQKEASNRLENVSSFDFRVTLRRDALNAFADAAGYAAKGESYDYAIHAARHYWNLCLPYLKQPQERATLFENLNEILAGLQLTFKFNSKEFSSRSKLFKSTGGDNQPTTATATNDEKQQQQKIVEKENKKTGNKDSTKLKQSSKTSITTKADANAVNQSESTMNHQSIDNEDAFDDLTLRCVLYACLFQILIDRRQFTEALEQMEKALNDLPRTKHRLLIYRFKVITKSKIGMDVQMDLQKFKEESEKNLAQMYRQVALSSLKHEDTIASYQRAIEALKVNSFKIIFYLVFSHEKFF